MPNPEQIDIRSSKLKDLAILSVAVTCFALSVFMLYFRPGDYGPNSMKAGSVSEFTIIFGVIFFGIYTVYNAVRLFSNGTVVSVGSRGIFDRRLSTDWIAWNDINHISVMKQNVGNGLVFGLNRSSGAALPLRSYAINILRTNASGTPSELWVEGDRLKGGFKALRDAVVRFHRIIDDPWAQ